MACMGRPRPAGTGTFLRVQGYERVGISLAKVNKGLKNLSFWTYLYKDFMAVKKSRKFPGFASYSYV